MQVKLVNPLVSAIWSSAQFNEQMWMGKSFTLIKYDFSTSGIFQIDFQYKRIIVEIFDPHLYIKSEKVLNIPSYVIKLQPGDVATVNLQAEYIETIRRPKNPCEEASKYSFTKCVKVIYEE